VFGSVARGEAGPDSDVDLLFELTPEARLGFGLLELEDELAGVFGRRVDLLSKETPFITCCGTLCSPRHKRFMQRDALLISEIIDATERILELASGATVADLNDDRSRREALF